MPASTPVAQIVAVTFVDGSGDATVIAFTDSTLDDDAVLEAAVTELNRRALGDDYDDHFAAGDLPYDIDLIDDQLNVAIHHFTPITL